VLKPFTAFTAHGLALGLGGGSWGWGALIKEHWGKKTNAHVNLQNPSK
jgi:hypothetical protein